MSFESDFRGDVNFDDLPDEAQYNVLSLFHDKRWGDIDDSASNSSSWLDCQIQIFDLLINVWAVKIDGCWRNWRDFAKNSCIYQLTKNNTITYGLKDIFLAYGQTIADVFILSENFVDVVSKALYFWG